MIERLRSHPYLILAGILPRADGGLAIAWWVLLVLRGLLPAVFAIAMGWMVATIEQGGDVTAPLAAVGIVFVTLQIASPIHQTTSSLLGARMAAWLYDQLTNACVRPPGMGHLENPKLTSDLSMARDFDMGITGPPLFIAMDFIAGGLIEMIGGLASAAVLFAFAWWAPLVLAGAWLSTHWLLRESAIWRDRNTAEVRDAQRHADYAYRLAVDPPAAKELRLFGLAGWVIERFRARRLRLHDLRWQATRLRQRPVIWSLLIVLAANILVFWSLGTAAADGALSLGRLVTFATAAVATSMIAFGGLSWALDGAAAPAAACLRLQAAMETEGALVHGNRSAAGMPASEVRFRNVTFAYPTASEAVLAGFDLTIPAGSSLAIVGQNGAGKTTIAKLLCRLYDPQAGAIEVDGVDLRELDLDGWRVRLAAVFQDFVRFEWPLRDNVAVAGAPDELIRQALADAGASSLADLDTVLVRGYPGGTDLSGGQWQRVALARAPCRAPGCRVGPARRADRPARRAR